MVAAIARILDSGETQKGIECQLKAVSKQIYIACDTHLMCTSSFDIGSSPG